jgi:hypothetical protein
MKLVCSPLTQLSSIFWESSRNLYDGGGVDLNAPQKLTVRGCVCVHIVDSAQSIRWMYHWKIAEYGETNSSVIEYAKIIYINLCKIDAIDFLRCYSVLKMT